MNKKCIVDKMIDLTKYTQSIKEDGCLTELFVVIKKDVYDDIRKHDGEFCYNERVFTLKEFNTDLIGLGYDCDYHVLLVMNEVDWSKRDRKIKELGL